MKTLEQIIKEQNELILKLQQALEVCGYATEFLPDGIAHDRWKNEFLPLLSIKIEKD